MSNCITCIKHLEDSFTCISLVLHVIKMKSLSHLLLKKKNYPSIYHLVFNQASGFVPDRALLHWTNIGVRRWVGFGDYFCDSGGALSTQSWTVLFGSLLFPIVGCLSLKTILSSFWKLDVRSNITQKQHYTMMEIMFCAAWFNLEQWMATC